MPAVFAPGLRPVPVLLQGGYFMGRRTGTSFAHAIRLILILQLQHARLLLQHAQLILLTVNFRAQQGGLLLVFGLRPVPFLIPLHNFTVHLFHLAKQFIQALDSGLHPFQIQHAVHGVPAIQQGFLLRNGLLDALNAPISSQQVFFPVLQPHHAAPPLPLFFRPVIIQG